ncbi:sugar phosphate isomerase/epimerase family protein [Niveibacterium umoris]|uniref:Sugar phosphate isomerase/epimerase n=2 Tax=Niveibacterium umoris TaxID=1193620 RepID=A0A840BPR5_9RHOO|nr:sugar phosphate isomerase/epimerase [Niveibacterium umoris]MBB4012836.1 sugar phosphate isomerase/epimerase [Niveibacterium umoris]
MSAPSPIIGLQLWTLRAQLASDFERTLETVAGMGYRAVEFAGFHGHSALQIQSVLRDTGLSAVSAHVPFDALDRRWADTVEEAHRLGVQQLVVARIDTRRALERRYWEEVAQRLNRAGEVCRAAGLSFAFHNHLAEFGRIPGTRQRPCDILLSMTDPALVSMQLDVGWCVAAGAAPGGFLRRYAGRISSVHLKDLTRLPQWDLPMPANQASEAFHVDVADVGAGLISWPTLVPLCRAAGALHAFVEHDMAADPIESARRSIGYLKRQGFAV